jgi:hypothetical protein
MGHPRGKGIPLPKSMQLGASSKGKSEVAGSLPSQGERSLRSSLKRSGASLEGEGNVKGGLMTGRGGATLCLRVAQGGPPQKI